MLITVTAATEEPVTLEEAKADLRMTHSSDDGLIERQITSARETVEQWTGWALAAATYKQTYGNVCVASLSLLPATIVEVTALEDDVRVATTEYTADEIVGQITFDELALSAVVEFTTDPSPVSETLKSAILLLVRAEYEASPEQAEKIRANALALCYPLRRTLGA